MIPKPYELQFSLQHNWIGNTFGLYLLSKSQSNGKKAIATNITFQTLEDNQLIEAPLLSLSQQEAQDLADQLYAVGIRPSQAAGSAGQLDAVKYHLEDMRTLVLKKATS